jgi:SH3-like domain-containing protein
MNTRSHAKKKKPQRLSLPFALLAAATVLLFSPSFSKGADPFVPITRYTAEPADLYQQPSPDARITIELEKGARLNLIDQQGDWFIAKLPNNRVGWIHSRFLTGRPPSPAGIESEPPPEPEPAAAPAQPPPESRPEPATGPEPTVAAQDPPSETAASEGLYMVNVKVDSGRIRSGPNREAPVIHGVQRGERAAVLETRGKWRRIRLADGRTGWGHRMLFSKTETGEGIPEAFQPEPGEAGPAGTTPPEEKSEAETRPEQKVLKNIVAITDETDEERVVFQLSGFHPPETFVLEEGTPKVVCDFMGVEPGEALVRRLTVDGDMIRRIRIGMHSEPRPKLRAVIDLVHNQAYSVEQIFLKGKGQYILTFKATKPD